MGASAGVELTQGYSTTIDEADLPLVSTYRWKILKANGKLYASRTVGRTGRTELMHRVLAGAGPRDYVDHENGDGLDNRRANLRVSTQSQNLANSRKTRGKSKYKGVYWNAERGKWQAQIAKDGVRFPLGRFDNEEDAARAYNSRATELFGKWAQLNVIEERQT